MAHKIRITKEFHFETGHALYGYDGLCKNVHGHSYTVAGTVIDFSDLKKIVKEEIVSPFDHATVLNVDSPHKELAEEMESRGHKVLKVTYQPTSEMMVLDFANKIKTRLPQGISLFALTLRETETSFAEWHAADNL
jgi:6-pyruvoyltetrahydropterin/6-carboxytetrahydropterin synthase